MAWATSTTGDYATSTNKAEDWLCHQSECPLVLHALKHPGMEVRREGQTCRFVLPSEKGQKDEQEARTRQSD